jgi:hypothetical protein
MGQDYYKTQSDETLVPAEHSGDLDFVEVISANTTLTVEDSGKTFLVATDALTITLPSTATGLEYTFINSGAAGNNIITVSPAAADGISGTITLAASVVVLDGTVNKDAINTKATSQAGDAITIVGSGTAGVTAWLVKSSTGIWAREA